MLLADVLPIEKPMPSALPPTKELDELKRRMDVVREAKSFADPQEVHSLKAMETRLAEKYVAQRREYFGEHLAVPEHHVSKDKPTEFYNVAMQAPKVKLSGVRVIADRLGFLVMPFAYMDPRAYEKDKAAAVVKNFADKLGRSTQVYALAPVQFYSAERHAKAEKDAEIYAPPMMSQAFMALDLAMPIFRSIMSEQSQMKKQFTEGLQGLEKRVDGLQALVEKHIRDTIAAKAAQEVENARLREALKQREFRMFDPLLLAVPQGASIRSSDVHAIVGPCWGPDAADIIFEAMGLAKIDGQREELLGFQERWLPNGAVIETTGESKIMF